MIIASGGYPKCRDVVRFRECCVDYQFRGESRSAAASPCGAFPPPLQGEGRGGDGVPQRRRDVTCSERKPIPTQTLPLKGRASKLGISARAQAARRDKDSRILPHFARDKIGRAHV